MVDLNLIVANAKNGCSKSMDKLYERYLPLIGKESEKIWFSVRDQTYFEQDCLKRIRQLVNDFDDDINKFHNTVVKFIYQVKSLHLKRSKVNNDNVVSINTLASDLDGKHEDYPIKDVLADVEQDILLKEKINLLAQADLRRTMILSQWIKGCTNDTEIATLLAQRCGGKFDSHRKFIQRFRTECQKTLSQVS